MNIIFSYDCEGNWAYIDWANPVLKAKHEEALANSYEDLISLHTKYKIPATFAFVGLYAMPLKERLDYVRENLGNFVEEYPSLVKNSGCWCGAENFNTVLSSDKTYTEIASHSLTHLPHDILSSIECSREFTESHKVLEKLSGTKPLSYVFPRNIISNRQSCKNTYLTFRNTPGGNIIIRGLDLFRSLSGLDFGFGVELSEFVYWRGGVRGMFSDNRWKKLWANRMNALKQRNTGNLTIHIWSHPHNLVTDPNVLGRIEWLMEILSNHSDDLNFQFLSEVTLK